MTENKLIKNITKCLYILLAIIPLLKENINSIVIILCFVAVLLNLILSQERKPLKKEFWILSSLFWLFLLHEVLSQEYNFDRILRYLPFLIFPILFQFRPKYIDLGIKKISILVFQFSVVLQCLIYVLLFLTKNSFDKLFYISPENIPFFREYVFGNYYFEIHPTYFSTFLLVSFTFSFFNVLLEKRRNIALNSINIIITLFFIFLFSSKVILLLTFLSIIGLLLYFLFLNGFKKAFGVVFISGLFTALIIYPSRNIIKERFDEIKTEINKPIVGDYYNSINTRVAIFKCSRKLLQEVPLFGFGDNLQSNLNDCYGEMNDSNFYKKHTFNTHNYYINLVLYGGWAFLIIFIGYLIFLYLKLRYSILALFILFQFILINITENYFSRHYGIVFFNYLICMLLFIKEKK